MNYLQGLLHLHHFALLVGIFQTVSEIMPQSNSAAALFNALTGAIPMHGIAVSKCAIVNLRSKILFLNQN